MTVNLNYAGILLEGQVAVGKTTIIEALQNALDGVLNVPIVVKHCHLHHHKQNDRIHDMAFSDFRVNDDGLFSDAFMRFNALRCLNVLYDHQLITETQPDNRFIIQDRNWFSYISTAMFFSPGNHLLSPHWFRENGIRFRHEIYLTCSAERRKQQLASRNEKPKSALHQFFENNPDVLVEFDSFSRALAEEEFGMSVFDVADLSLEAITGALCSRINPGDF